MMSGENGSLSLFAEDIHMSEKYLEHRMNQDCVHKFQKSNTLMNNFGMTASGADGPPMKSEQFDKLMTLALDKQ